MKVSNSNIEKMLERAGFHEFTFSSIGADHYNDSYYVDSPHGRYVLRIAPPDDVPKLFYEIDMMKSEVNIHRLLRENTNVPVPEIICHDFSRKIIDGDYLVMEFLEGRSGPFSEGELGYYVRQIHSIESDMYGYPERAAPAGESWPDIFRTYFGLILKDCLSCGVIDDSEHEYFMSVYERYSNAVVDVRPSLLHLDLWTQNILTIDGQITAVLDFDRGLYGDPELEFAVLDTYGYSGPEFFEGYGIPRPADSTAQVRQKLYIVYELIKYAFIRLARGGSMSVGRSHVMQCKRILQELE